MFDEEALLKQLDPRLRIQCYQFLIEHTVGEVDFFKEYPAQFQHALIEYLMPLSCDAGRLVMERGEHATNLIFLTFGEVSLTTKIAESQSQVAGSGGR